MAARYESWVDKQIREAQERGEFDDLPSAGKRLDFLDRPVDPDWWARSVIAREQLDTSALMPPQIALRRERERLPETVLRARTEAAARELAEDFNARVREFWRRPVDGPVLPVRVVDVEALVADWRALDAERRRRARAEAPPPEVAAPPRRWWSRRR